VTSEHQLTTPTPTYDAVTAGVDELSYQRALSDLHALEARVAALQADTDQRATAMKASEARTLRREREAALSELRSHLDRLSEQVATLGDRPAQMPLIDAHRAAQNRALGVGDPLDERGPRFIEREQRDGMADWARSRYPAEHERELSFGKILHGLVSGDWRNAHDEHRAIGEGTSAAGGVLVPTPVASNIIDRARNVARVTQAGARVVPMESQTLKVPRLVTEPDASSKWRLEAAAISEDNLTFDSVTLTAQSLSFYVKASRELVEDGTAGGGVETVLRNSFAEVVALELDRAALLGTGTAPQPRGVLNQTGVTLTDHGANGTAISSYDWWIDAVATVRANNFEPTAQIQAPRTEQSLSKLKDTTNAYLTPPAALANIPRYTTKQVPITITVGTSTDTSYVFTGQFDQLWIGIRTTLTIDVLRERFMTDSGQYAFLCWLRADVAVAQPSAFVVDRGVRA
jgi:HK97 family phage major capsid protein